MQDWKKLGKDGFPKKKRKLSRKARVAISNAQKARWAEKKAQGSSIPKGVVPAVEETQAEAVIKLVKELGKSQDYLTGYIDGYTVASHKN